MGDGFSFQFADFLRQLGSLTCFWIPLLLCSIGINWAQVTKQHVCKLMDERLELHRRGVIGIESHHKTQSEEVVLLAPWHYLDPAIESLNIAGQISPEVSWCYVDSNVTGVSKKSIDERARIFHCLHKLKRRCEIDCNIFKPRDWFCVGEFKNWDTRTKGLQDQNSRDEGTWAATILFPLTCGHRVVGTGALKLDEHRIKR